MIVCLGALTALAASAAGCSAEGSEPGQGGGSGVNGGNTPSGNGRAGASVAGASVAGASGSIAGSPSGGEPGAGNGGPSGSGGGSGISPDAAAGGVGGGFDDTCVQERAEADFTMRPVDVIFIVDTSASMTKEIEGVQNNINQNFAQIIASSGVDYRVIVIGDHEGLVTICITGMLNPSGACGGADNPPLYYHYAMRMGSADAWCKLLTTYRSADQAGQSPGGWSQWLRPEALKVFVVLTDDNVNCSPYLNSNPAASSDDEANAVSFDSALLALDPLQFGSADNRNYVWHSLVGLRENTPATEAYLPGDPMVNGVCGTSINEGHGYQALSRLSGGLRFPVCEGFNFDVVFQEIARGVVRGSIIKCEFAVPESPTVGRYVDRTTVEVIYTPGDGGPVDRLREADLQTTCNDHSFYFDGDFIRLCPAACDRVQNDPGAQLDVLWGCTLPPLE